MAADPVGEADDLSSLAQETADAVKCAWNPDAVVTGKQPSGR